MQATPTAETVLARLRDLYDELAAHSQGTDADPVKSQLTGSSPADGVTPGSGDIIRAGSLYNGSTWDRQRGTIEGDLLASAARTTDGVSSNQTNYNAKGVTLYLNITSASGTRGLRPRSYVSSKICP